MENEMQRAENNDYDENAFSSSLGYIEHSVSKLDTLAGIAIKYGVEVVDIKKMNGLITDRQMFALKTIHIPLPGRHLPSPCLPSGSSNVVRKGSSDHSSSDHAHRELFESFQSLCRVKSSGRKMSLANYAENGSTKSERTLQHHRKSRSLVNVIFEEIMEKTDIELSAEVIEGKSAKWNDKLVQKRLKSEADFTKIPELLLKEDNSSSVGLPSRTGKSLALRSKSINRMAQPIESESIGLSPMVTSMGDAFIVTDGVRKSSSTSCLQDQDSGSSSYIWPTSMWSLKPDLQSFPRPTTARRNKAALD